MTEDNQVTPLAPPQIHPRSDDDEESGMFKLRALRQEKTSKWPVHVLCGIVIVSAILLILAIVFLRASTPQVKFSSVAVKNLKQGNSSSPYVNATLVTEMTIKNKNFGYFEFDNTTGKIMYGSRAVGDVKISRGRAKGRETKRMNLAVDVRMYSLSGTKNLSADISSGMLNMSSHAQLSGEVHLINIVKKKKTAEMSCTMELNLTSQSIQNLHCT